MGQHGLLFCLRGFQNRRSARSRAPNRARKRAGLPLRRQDKRPWWGLAEAPRSCALIAVADLVVLFALGSVYNQLSRWADSVRVLLRAKQLATRLARELDPEGSVGVLACDSTCRNSSTRSALPTEVCGTGWLH